MITVDEALKKILSHIQPLGLEKVSLNEALGRVIGEDIYANRNIPPLDNSGMDGYAVKWEDVKNASKEHPSKLEVIESVQAGFIATKAVGKDQAIKIMTGAPIPKGADVVVPVEETEKGDASVLIFVPGESGENIRKGGEDVKKGDLIIPAGDVIRPAEIGMIASVGRSFISVYQKPIVSILCTGEELVDVDGDLTEAKIVSSNSYTLSAQVRECGAIPVQLGIARDRKEDIMEKLHQGIRGDVLISSAGISVGDYDFVKDALYDLGMEMIFWQVAMKPGKPLAFGTISGKPAFGLPGNPVSSMVSFEKFVRPSLLKMMGHSRLFRPVIEATLKDDIRKKPGRRHFVRGFLTFEKGAYVVSTTGEQGSGILRSMLKANGLIVIAEDHESVRAGEKVDVELMDHHFLCPDSGNGV